MAFSDNWGWGSSSDNSSTNQQPPQNSAFYSNWGPNNSQQSSDPWTGFKQQAQSEVSAEGLPSSVVPVLEGQAAVESARGTSNFAQSRNNYFGINAIDSDPNQATSYSSPKASIKAYLSLIESYPGVSQAIESGNPDAIIRAIEANGYASDPNYVSKVEGTPEFQQSSQISQ